MEADWGSVWTRRLLPGVYVPTMCFFDQETFDMDIDTIVRHAVRLARAGVVGLATQGSNGESVHLTSSERQLVSITTREALNDSGLSQGSIVAGCAGRELLGTVALLHMAERNGADYALVLPPSYYTIMFASADELALEYFRKLADASPIPILVYNFPSAANGRNLPPDILASLVTHPNIFGIKWWSLCPESGALRRLALRFTSQRWLLRFRLLPGDAISRPGRTLPSVAILKSKEPSAKPTTGMVQRSKADTHEP
jgi:4-hydroxy-2-oxoglutarate aldolase